jgi:hypothetical protein
MALLRDPSWSPGRGATIETGDHPAASTGAALTTRACSPADVMSAAGARSQSPRQGDRSQPARPSASAAPAAPTARSRAAQVSSAPASRQAMSSQTWATTGGRGVVAYSA